MIESIDDLSPAVRAGFDAIIDVRTAAEFATDHVPGAINLPVLNEAERALVGTIYTQGVAVQGAAAGRGADRAQHRPASGGGRWPSGRRRGGR